MNYRLPDEEYAVLDYIRTRNGTHIDHLKLVFGPVAVTAVDHLYQYGLIDPDFPNEDIYYASDLGKAYRHEEAEQSNVTNKENSKDFCDNPANIKSKQKLLKNPLFWAIASVISTIVIGIASIITAIVIAKTGN